MESEATQLYRWFQSRANAQAAQRPRATLGALSASQQAKLQAELQGIIIAVCGTSSREPAAGAMAVMSRAVMQFIEVLMNRALDHAATAGGTEFSEKNILGVLSQHNEYQAARAATLTRKYHRIQKLTSFEATRVPVEGFHESEQSACHCAQAGHCSHLIELVCVVLSRYRPSSLPQQQYGLRVSLQLALSELHFSKRRLSSCEHSRTCLPFP